MKKISIKTKLQIALNILIEIENITQKYNTYINEFEDIKHKAKFAINILKDGK